MTSPETARSTSLRTFYIVWAGQLVSITGTALTGFGLQFWIYAETRSVTQLSVVALAYAVPGVLFAPLAGSVIDRFDRRLVMLLADVAAGAATLSMLWVFTSGALQLWFICVVIAVGATANAFQEPAWMASISVLVPRVRLARANGLEQFNRGLAFVLAPAMAGALLGTLGLGAVLLADIATFAVGVVTLAAVRFPPFVAEQVAERSVRGDTRFAWRYLTDRPGLLWLLWIYSGVNFMMSMTFVLLIPLIVSFSTETAAGVVLSIGGLGAVVGSLLVGWFGEPKRLIRLIMGGIGISGMLTAIGGLRPSLLVIGIPTTIVLLLNPIINSASHVVWQTKVAEGAQGRVFSLRRMIGQAISPIAIALAGPVADGWFEPALAADGALAGSVGTVIGVGAGRGIGLIHIIAGLGIVGLALLGWGMPRVRNIETELPDLAGR